MTDISKEEMEQLINHYEYERAYKISKEIIKNNIKKARGVLNNLFDDIESSIDRMMNTARVMKGGGASLGKVWNLYPNNPDISDYQTTKDHIKHFKDSKYPFEKMLKILEGEC